MPSGAFKRLSIRSKIGPEGLNDPQLFRCWEQSEFGNSHDLSLLLCTYPVNFLAPQEPPPIVLRSSVFSLNIPPLGHSVSRRILYSETMKTKLLTLLSLTALTLSAAFADGYVIGPNGITTFYGNCRQGSAVGPNGVTVWNNGPTGGTIIGPEGTTVWSGTQNQIIVTGSAGTSLWSSPSGIKIIPCGICE